MADCDSDRESQFKKYNSEIAKRYGLAARPVSGLIDAIPLLFHQNIELAPGYVGPLSACGIESFTPDKKHIQAIKLFNSEYDPEKYVAAEPDIESVYYQEDVIYNEKYIWVIHKEDLKRDRLQLLVKKITLIKKWLAHKKLKVDIYAVSHAMIANYYFEKKGNGLHLDKKIFLEQFYSETVLLAGVVAKWWLTEEGDNNQSSDQWSDLEGIAGVRPVDYYAHAVWSILNIARAPFESWLNLLITAYKISHIDEKMTIERIKAELGGEQLDLKKIKGRDESISDMVGVVSQKENLENTKKILKIFYMHRSKENQQLNKLFMSLDNLAIISGGLAPSLKEYASLYDYIYADVSVLFTKICRLMNEERVSDGVNVSNIDEMSKRMLNRLKDNNVKYNILNGVNQFFEVQEKILLEEVVDETGSLWFLKIPDSIHNEDCTKIRSFRTFLELIVWGFYNGLIGESSRVQVSSRRESIDSVSVINIIRYMASHIKLRDLDENILNSYVEDKEIRQVILFIDVITEDGIDEPVIYQLIVFNTDEFEVQEFRGYSAAIGCAYGWHGVVEAESKTGKLIFNVYGIRSGSAKKVEGDLTRYIHDLDVIEKKGGVSRSKIILKHSNTYYVTEVDGKEIETSQLEGSDEFYRYMEEPADEFIPCSFSGAFDKDKKLSYLFDMNKENVLQLFFYIDKNKVTSYVFDLNGSMVMYEDGFIDRQLYLNHWLRFFNNLKDKMALDLRYSVNQLVTIDAVNYEHIAMSGEYLSEKGKAIHVAVDVENDGNTVDLVFKLLGSVYRTSDYGKDIYKKIYDCIAHSDLALEDSPVYISDIGLITDMKNRERGYNAEEIIYFLTYKKNVEKQLKKRLAQLH